MLFQLPILVEGRPHFKHAIYGKNVSENGPIRAVAARDVRAEAFILPSFGSVGASEGKGDDKPFGVDRIELVIDTEATPRRTTFGEIRASMSWAPRWATRSKRKKWLLFILECGMCCERDLSESLCLLSCPERRFGERERGGGVTTPN